jgi:hypothetical protein
VTEVLQGSCRAIRRTLGVAPNLKDQRPWHAAEKRQLQAKAGMYLKEVAPKRASQKPELEHGSGLI